MTRLNRLPTQIGRAAALATALLPSPLAAQPASTTDRFDDAAYVAFGRRDGLPDASIMAVHPTADGRLLAATSAGARLYDGRQWTVLPSPPMLDRQDFRSIFDRANGDRVFVHSFGVIVQRGTTFPIVITIPPTDAPIYSAVALPNGSGGDDVLIGAAGGVFQVNANGRLDRVTLPTGMPVRDAMLAVRRPRVNAGAELWVGTREGGVARRDATGWTRWTEADGLPRGIEHVALAPAGDTLTAVVATERGAFALHGERWSPLGPRVITSRVLRVRIGSHFETWVGALGGELYRSTDDRQWQLVDISTRIRGSRVQSLVAIEHGLRYPTVYAGFRSGTLLRFRLGMAGRVVVPTDMVGHPVPSMSPTLDAGNVWTWMQGIGAVRLPEVARVVGSSSVLGGGDGRTRMLVHQTTGGPQLYMAVEWRVYRQRGNQWVLAMDHGPGEYVHRLATATGPDGRTGVVAVFNRTAWISYDDGPFTQWAGFPEGVQVVLTDSSRSPASLLVLANAKTMAYLVDGRWEALAGGVAPTLSRFVDAHVFRYPSGECGLLIGTTEGLALLRTCGGPPAWRVFNDVVLPGLPGNEVTDMTPLRGGRTAVATTRGLAVLTHGRAFDDSVRLSMTFNQADGLPHPLVMALGPVDADNRLWIGTALGAGYANVDETDRFGEHALHTRVTLHDIRGAPIADQSRIAESNNRIDVDVALTTHHREDETMYRFELDGALLHPSDWTDRQSASIMGAAAGTHVLRVRARDYQGREAPTVERTFTIVLPWWRTPLALVVYVTAVVFGIYMWVRQRTFRERQRVLEAEANEQRVAISEARFRRLFEDSDDPQVLVLDGSVWQLNAAAERLLASGDGDARAQSIDTLLPGLSATLQQTIGTGRWELDAIGPERQRIPVEVRRTRIPIEGATLDHLGLTDLRERRRLETERQQLEAQLRESQRLESVGTLAGGVAHDFNNLLTVIHTNAELAVSDVPSASPTAEALQQLLVASRRAKEVVRQILTFSRRAETRRTEVRVETLMREIQSLLRAIVPSTVRLVVDNTAHDAVVSGDETQLQQLLLNLCSNAEYAMRATNGGTLTVSARWCERNNGDADSICVSVTDTGTGIAPDVRNRMFEPFFTTKPVGEGTGLGLSVLHGIVGAHGGTVQVTSEVGRGTTVDVSLPARRVAPTDRLTPAVGAAGIPAARHVLLVDDEPAVARAVQRMLERNGYVVELANDGAQAFSRLCTDNTIDLVITDQTMPVMTGTELIENMRTSGITLPVVLASGYGAAIDGTRLDTVTDVWRIDKPFASNELLALLANVATANR